MNERAFRPKEVIFDRHISLGSILSAITALGAVAGVYAAFQANAAVQEEKVLQIEGRISRLEANREMDRKEIQQTLGRIEEALGEIKVSLATKRDIRDDHSEVPRRRPAVAQND
jgi:hypothetical protein